MRITRIQIDNLLGIKTIDVKPGTPITLFAGLNGSAKSSIAEAVKMAIGRDIVRDVKLKKEYDLLVHDGEKAGGAQVIVDNDAENSYAFSMPKGDFTGPEVSESMRVALDGQRFAHMTKDERRSFLFALTKCKRNGEAVKARMLSPTWTCDEKKVDIILPMLKTGFQGMCDAAKENATKAKGAWKAITNEVYGSVKGEAWEAAAPDAADGDTAALAAKVAALDKTIATLNGSLGAIRQAASTNKAQADKRATLAEAPAKLASITEQLALAQKNLAEYEPTVVALRTRAAGKARIGLVHDMAVHLETYLPSMASSNAAHEAKALLGRYETEHGKLGAKVDTEAQSMLPDHENGLTVMQNRVKNLQRDVETAREANAQFNALAPAGEDIDASTEVAEVEALISKAKIDRQAAENARLDLEAAQRKVAEAAQKTKSAKAHHADVVAWLKIADALAPSGIPSELLAAALAPVNEALAQAAVDTDWAKAAVDVDMDLTASGRPYQLLSESEQWRWDAMFAQVVAELSGLKILMLDRVDVLDLPGRSQLFGWLDTLADLKLVDTALLFATLKEAPKGLAESVECFWVQQGTIAGARQLAAA